MKVKITKCSSSKCRKLKFPHVSEQCLERYIKENTKTTGLCTIYNITVNEKFMKTSTELGHFFRFIVCYHGSEDNLILSNCSRNRQEKFQTLPNCVVVFSLPEPKAHGWANSIPVTLSSVRQHFQTSPLKPLRANWTQISYGDSLGRGNENLFKWFWSHDQGDRHAHIW